MKPRAANWERNGLEQLWQRHDAKRCFARRKRNQARKWNAHRTGDGRSGDAAAPTDPARSQAIEPICPSPHDRTVAITFDDLPYTRAGDAGGQDLAAVARATNEAILAGLARGNVPAIGFVIERRVQALGEIGQAILEPWNTGQLELGNHSANHPDSNTLDVDAFRREVIDGEATIRPMVEKAGRTLRFFRFPYNHLGDTDRRREAFERVLGERGYYLAASTIDTSDYVFDAAYERALARSDTAIIRRIEDAYIDYSRAEIAYYAGLNRKVLGCEPPGILLLHANRINAATIDRILGLFRSVGYRFVSLEEAQARPAYRASPRFATKFGPMWGYRWAKERDLKVDGSKEEEPPAWVTQYSDADAPL